VVTNLRVAVVGIGKMGLVHASLLSTVPNVQLVALCDKSPMILRFFRKVFRNTSLVDDVEKLSGLDLDAVYVTTPIPSHFPVLKAILSMDIARNIFVEKTLSSSYDEARELCQIVEDSGVGGMVGYMKRFSVTFSKAKELLDQRILGEDVGFDAYAYSSDFTSSKKGSKAQSSRGGVMRDLGAHVIDLAMWFFGDLEIESAKVDSTGGIGSEGSASFRTVNAEGSIGSFDISWCAAEYRLPEFGLAMRGTKGTMKVNDDRLELALDNGKLQRWYRHDLQDNVGFLLGEPEYFREDEEFIKSITEKRSAKPDFLSASKVDRLIEQAEQRAAKHE
jgi:predicted dehydrogenase